MLRFGSAFSERDKIQKGYWTLSLIINQPFHVATNFKFIPPNIITEWGVPSVARFCYVFSCDLRGPAWAIGSYSISQSSDFPKHYLQSLATDRTPRSVE